MDMKELNEIRSQIGLLRRKIREAEAQLEEAGLRAMGLKRGDVIRASNGRQTMLISVTGCRVGHLEPRPLGVKIKADGTPGQVSAGHIDQWEKVDG